MSQRRRAFTIIGIGAVGLVLLFTTSLVIGLRINLTPSYPPGLWRIVPFDRQPAIGDLVFICPPATPAFVNARERAYLRPGLCPGWLSPLIKTVAALPGHNVQIAHNVIVDGVSLPHSDVRSIDAVGRTLVPHSGGVVPENNLFLHSSYAGSYDSRYFGPIPASGLLGLARPVLTFGQ